MATPPAALRSARAPASTWTSLVRSRCRGSRRKWRARLFRIAQEALNNTVKHAGAQRASIELRSRPGACTLTIADDGVGFDPEHPAQPGARAHWGLEMMRERAEAVGARF